MSVMELCIVRDGSLTETGCLTGNESSWELPANSNGKIAESVRIYTKGGSYEEKENYRNFVSIPYGNQCSTGYHMGSRFLQLRKQPLPK